MGAKSVWVVVGLVLAGAGVAQTYRPSVPDVEGAQDALFRRFDELSRMGVYVAGADGEKLLDIRKGFGVRSGGLFGYGRYGGNYGSHSAYSTSASSPPLLMVKRGSETFEVGLVTTNRFARTRGQRINPYCLEAWMNSR